MPLCKSSLLHMLLCLQLPCSRLLQWFTKMKIRTKYLVLSVSARTPLWYGILKILMTDRWSSVTDCLYRIFRPVSITTSSRKNTCSNRIDPRLEMHQHSSYTHDPHLYTNPCSHSSWAGPSPEASPKISQDGIIKRVSSQVPQLHTFQVFSSPNVLRTIMKVCFKEHKLPWKHRRRT